VKHVRGLDIALKHVKQLEDKYEERAKNAVSKSTQLMEAQAKALSPVQTGHLRQNIKTYIEDGGLRGKVISHAEYSQHVEYGTSKQEAQPYMGPAYFKAKQHFEKLLKDRR
jgi:HK97 gp10 family phage protein